MGTRHSLWSGRVVARHPVTNQVLAASSRMQVTVSMPADTPDGQVEIEAMRQVDLKWAEEGGPASPPFAALESLAPRPLPRVEVDLVSG